MAFRRRRFGRGRRRSFGRGRRRGFSRRGRAGRRLRIGWRM